jgi:hypothetical protein
MNPNEPPCEVRISFQDGEGTLLVTPMGPNLYRLEVSSILGEASYHDMIETEPQTDGSVRFLRVTTPSGLTTLSCVLSQNLLDSPAMSALLEKVMAVGGNWERIFGGFLILHVPPTERDHITAEFNNLFSQSVPPK